MVINIYLYQSLITGMNSDNDNQETVLFRRLYFLFPDTVYARQAVNELKGMGIAENDMHTVAKKKVDLTGLPLAKKMIKEDKGRFVEDLFWIVNLTVFFSALALFMSDLFQGLSLPTLIPLVVIAVCGYYGSKMTGIPNVHMEDFNFAIRRGEILLMVDMPEDCIARVEDNIQAKHPEVIIGGVGTTIESTLG